jgi:hypothetical protein
MMTVLRGGCHCGNLKVALETSLDPSVLQLRACQCSFCRRHGAVTTSDPAGRLLVEVGQPELLVRYRFALGITDFLVCRAVSVIPSQLHDRVVVLPDHVQLQARVIEVPANEQAAKVIRLPVARSRS